MENDVGVGARDDIGLHKHLNIERHTKVNRRGLSVLSRSACSRLSHNTLNNVIDSKHLVAFGQRAVNHCGPDEPGGPGNEGSHSGVSCPTKASRCLSVTTEPRLRGLWTSNWHTYLTSGVNIEQLRYSWLSPGLVDPAAA